MEGDLKKNGDRLMQQVFGKTFSICEDDEFDSLSAPVSTFTFFDDCLMYI